MLSETRHRRLALLAAGLLLLVMGGLALLAPRLAEEETRRRASEREAAEAIWRSAGPTRYRLVLQKDGCRSESLVQGDVATIATLPSTCDIPPSTVPLLFELIARDGLTERLCDTRGCPCESRTSVRATYHARLGYPEQTIVTVSLRPAWLTADLWQHLAAEVRLPPCMSTETRTIAVLELRPEP